MADADKYGFDAASFGTTVTVDEAVAMLLGMVDGPVRFRVTHDNPTAEEQEHLDCLTFSVAEELNETKEQAESDLAEAKAEGQPNEIIDRKCAAVEKATDEIAKARTFFCDIEDELSKGESSALRTYKTPSSIESTHLTISSLDEWARKRYGISFLCRGASVGAGQEKQEPPNAVVNTEEEDALVRIPRTKQLEQGYAIVAAIERLGYDPKQLPRSNPRKPGVKSKVRDLLKGSPLFEAKSSFKKAWDELRANKDIADAKVSPPPK
jgi:hypothetical protein